LAVTSIKLTLLVLLIVPVVIVPILFYGRRVRRLSRDSQDAIAAFGAYAEETINAIRTVQAFTHEAMDRARFQDARGNGLCRSTPADRGACRAHRARHPARLRGDRVSSLDRWPRRAGWAHQCRRSVGLRLLRPSSWRWQSVRSPRSGATSSVPQAPQRRSPELLDSGADIKAPAGAGGLPDPPRGVVTFEDVGFCYPASPGRSALQGFTITVLRGETVALVGASGAGKTTVFQLLLRFYDPQHGGRADRWGRSARWPIRPRCASGSD